MGISTTIDSVRHLSQPMAANRGVEVGYPPIADAARAHKAAAVG